MTETSVAPAQELLKTPLNQTNSIIYNLSRNDEECMLGHLKRYLFCFRSAKEQITTDFFTLDQFYDHFMQTAGGKRLRQDLDTFGVSSRTSSEQLQQIAKQLVYKQLKTDAEFYEIAILGDEKFQKNAKQKEKKSDS